MDLRTPAGDRRAAALPQLPHGVEPGRQLRPVRRMTELMRWVLIALALVISVWVCGLGAARAAAAAGADRRRAAGRRRAGQCGRPAALRRGGGFPEHVLLRHSTTPLRSTSPTSRSSRAPSGWCCSPAARRPRDAPATLWAKDRVETTWWRRRMQASARALRDHRWSAALALAGCSGNKAPQLMNFALERARPGRVRDPADQAAADAQGPGTTLPPPTPGGANLTDPTPRPTPWPRWAATRRGWTGPAIPAGDGALVDARPRATASAPTSAQTLAAEDLECRKAASPGGCSSGCSA